MAWAFQDPEHGSTTSKASGAPTTTFVNPEYQPLATNRSQVGCLRCVPDLQCVICVVPYKGKKEKSSPSGIGYAWFHNLYSFCVCGCVNAAEL